MSRILVIRGGAIGDFILTLPALKLLRDAFPDARIEILGYKHIIALAELGGYADATRSIEYGPLASFFARDGELSPELVEYFGSFQQVVSYLFDPDGILADEEHAVRQLARRLERLALYLDDPAAALTLPNATEVEPERLAIHPGSGSETKNWLIKRFEEIGRSWLSPNDKRTILLVGGEADIERLEILRKTLPNDRVEVAQHLGLPELAARLRACASFLGHDSGISHLAAAVGTPCLLLFGPTDPAIWAPLNPQVRILRSPSLTMDGISVAEVEGALTALDRGAGSPRD